MQDMQVWNMISDYQVEVLYADKTGDESKLYESAYKIKFICADNLTQEIADLINYDFDFDADQIIDWVINDEKSTVSPFSDEDYVNSYYADAQEILAESEAVLAEGQQDNTRGDTFNLVTVIYSVVLFMLGIVGTFRRPAEPSADHLRCNRGIPVRNYIHVHDTHADWFSASSAFSAADA